MPVEGRLTPVGGGAGNGRRARLGPSLQQIVVVALAIALLVLGGIAGVSYASMSRLVSAVDEMERSNDLLETVARAYARVADAEASSRGYALTGDPDYLLAYRGAEAAVAGELAALERLAAGDTAHARRLTTLRGLVARRFDVIDRGVAVRTRDGFAAAQALVRTGQGKAVMDSLRTLAATLQQEERQRLALRSASERVQVRRTARLIGAGILLTFGISILAALFVQRDVSAAARAERALREAKEAAETASRTKSRFLANMSHELRTPLNSIIGFANVLLKRRDAAITASEVSYLERIRANGVHLLSLINEVLDLSKVEAGHAQLALAPLALDELVRDAIAGFEGQLRERDVELRAELPSPMAPLVTDGAKLLQVLNNLIGNALKFTEQGSVTVRVAVDERTRAPLRLEVVDTGIGIPIERRAAIFEPFEQADSSTSRRYGGTGLGLSISRALCHSMGYRLELAEPATGTGSIFRVVLATRSAPRRERESVGGVG